MQINEVTEIHRTAEEDVLLIYANITASGETLDVVHAYRSSDPHGLGPVFNGWLALNPEFPILDYVPPTTEAQRELMPDLTGRQLRLALIGNGITTSQVTTAIGSIPNELDRDKAMVEWEYASSFARLHPLIATVGAALGLTDEQIDAMWLAALSL